VRAGLIILAIAVTGCGFRSQSNSTTDWPLYNGDYASTRFSPLTGITPQNVTGLRQVCAYNLPEAVTFESGPVAVQGTLYFTTYEYTYAVDAGTCRLKWRARHPIGTIPAAAATRGVAYLDNHVFRGSYDGNVIAYDVANGQQTWITKLTAPDSGEFISAAPIAWSGMIFIGTAGGDSGSICHVAALDAATGRILWNFPLVATGAARGSDTWPKGTRLAGGSTWTSFTLDPESGALYVPAGNPVPDFAGSYRPGANLYTGSIVVLDARSGALRTWYQLAPHDIHDWDVAAAPALITTKQGKRRAMAAGKDGNLDAIDVAVGKILWKTPVSKMENVDAPLTVEGTRFCPGTRGGTLWNGPAYSPNHNLVYVNSVDWCATVKLDPRPRFEPGKSFVGSVNGYGEMDPLESRNGWVTAIDADSGAIRWRYRTTTPMLAAILPTASGLVITADLNGDVLAFDAATGRLLHRIATHQPVAGGIIAYQLAGQERIAVAGGFASGIYKTTGRPVVFVFGL
jgi:PQQ-dependent dehydrogenase (methanol/ethanol family)